MLGKRLRDDQDPGACPKSEVRPWLCAGMRGEAAVEPGKPCPRHGAVALRHGGERRVELRAKTKQSDHAAKLHELAAHGERGQEQGAWAAVCNIGEW